MVREIPAHVSPSLKKRRAEDLAKFIKKNQRTEEEEKVPETHEVHIQEEVKISPPVTISKPVDSRPVEQGHIISLPQVTSTTDSPTFQSIMDQPFTTIFSTQSTDPPNPSSPVDETMATDAGTHNEGFGGTFEALHFDTSEEDFPDYMLMTMKPFKILNSKLNSILQSQADVGSVGVTSLEVDSLMKLMEGRVISKASRLIKDSESRVLEKVDQHHASTENRINSQNADFVREVKDLKMVTKERNVLFVQEVKKVREDVNLQIRELCEEMQKEVQIVQQDYASANQKIDIICDAFTRCIKLF
ncbi:unnamed protein product [Lactuca saligna]|uniref:Uncharacterized protein n=1 Tax=Lactuca saligna TaxID=75948 RepID=A0AA35YNR6_LACSI|nr:unnamed protein product [Lactuca saligna]